MIKHIGSTQRKWQNHPVMTEELKTLSANFPPFCKFVSCLGKCVKHSITTEDLVVLWLFFIVPWHRFIVSLFPVQIVSSTATAGALRQHSCSSVRVNTVHCFMASDSRQWFGDVAWVYMVRGTKELFYWGNGWNHQEDWRMTAGSDQAGMICCKD